MKFEGEEARERSRMNTQKYRNTTRNIAKVKKGKRKKESAKRRSRQE